MLGMEGIWVAVAWILNIVAAIGCVIYGVVMWNKGDDSE